GDGGGEELRPREEAWGSQAEQVSGHVGVELEPEAKERAGLGEDRAVRHGGAVGSREDGETQRAGGAARDGRIRPHPFLRSGFSNPRVRVRPSGVDGHALVDRRVPVDARVEPHIPHRLGVRRVEVEHETTAFARGELGRLLAPDELVHLADGGEVLGGGRGHKKRGDEEERKGQGRGPHVTRRSWSPLIYISRSISSQRVKTAIPFVRRMPVLAVARERAEDLLQELMVLQLVDETRKITKRGREI